MSLVPGWISLRKIGKSSLAKATIFMPIVGYFVIFNDEISKYLTLIAALSGAKTSSADLNLTRLVSVYIGLLFVGTASIIFLLFCPSEIAETESEHEFNQNEMDLMNPFRLAKIQQHLRHMVGAATTPSQREEIAQLSRIQTSDTVGGAFTLGSPPPPLSWPDWIGRNKSAISAIVTLRYLLLDNARYWARLPCIICYCVGFLFLFLPSAEVFLRATFLISKMLRALFS